MYSDGVWSRSIRISEVLLYIKCIKCACKFVCVVNILKKKLLRMSQISRTFYPLRPN